MKNTPLILSIVSLAAVAALGILMLTNGGNGSAKTTDSQENADVPTKGEIAYFNLDRVLNEYDMANDLRATVESKIQSINQEVNRRGNNLQNEMSEFQNKIDKGLLTRSIAEAQGEKLNKKQNDFRSYAQKKEQEIAEEQQVMMNNIGDAIKTYIDRFNETAKYAFIFATQGGVLPTPVVAADGANDITDTLLAGLNEEYVKNKNKENK